MSSTVHNRRVFGKANGRGVAITSSSYTSCNLSKTLTCKGNRPVLVKVIERSSVPAYVTCDYTGATGQRDCFFGCEIDGLISAELQLGRNWSVAVNSDVRIFPLSFLEWIVYPTAGLHTFSIKAKVYGASSIVLTDCSLLVVEL